MRKLLVICGPTATGKTSLAIKLCRKFGGEIVSADSRQVYQGMDIGTGKEISNIKYQISKTQIKNQNFFVYKIEGVPLWLWDVVAPDYRFSVADYVKCANLVIGDIWQGRKLPILVGGTGFYIKGVVGRIGTMGIEPNWKLRQKLQNYTVLQLRQLLEKTCPERLRKMNESDRRNPRRLLRAIEVALWKLEMGGGKKKNSHLSFQYPASNFSHLTSILFIGLTAPRKILYRKADLRIEEMFHQGLLKEVKALAGEYGWPAPGLRSIGYAEFRLYFEGKGTLEEVRERIKFNTHAYIRRQLTWFRRNSSVRWFDVSQDGFDNQIERLVKSYLE